ncbi:glycerate kinase, partial [Bordetella pertussis]
VGLGGSATNDGGAGMLTALGVRWLDADGRALAPGGAALADVRQVDASGLDARLRGVVVEIASDVDNPLCGPHGASHTFGPQKGATPEQVRQLDAALAHMAEIVTRAGHPDQRAAPGADAAGGL